VAWDRLKLMVALIVVAFLGLLVFLNRDSNRAPSDRRPGQWHWPTSKKKTALALGALVSVGLVVLVNHLGDSATTGDERLKVEYLEPCTDEQGRFVPPPWAGLKGEGKFIGKVRGDRTIYQGANGNEISCPSPRVGG
jgi:hypothetical protein